jgi:hypothetical protein
VHGGAEDSDGTTGVGRLLRGSWTAVASDTGPGATVLFVPVLDTAPLVHAVPALAAQW